MLTPTKHMWRVLADAYGLDLTNERQRRMLGIVTGAIRVRGAAAFTDYAEDKVMDFLFNNGSAINITTMYAKLHLGDPGETAASNAATETTRDSFTVAASSGGVCSNEAQLDWASYPAAETVSHISIWDAATNGNAMMKGALTASKAMGIGDTLSIPTGDLDLAAQ